MNTILDTQRPLVALRYPGREIGQWSWAVIKPSNDNADVYEIASSWFDSEVEALRELRRMRGVRGER